MLAIMKQQVPVFNQTIIDWPFSGMRANGIALNFPFIHIKLSCLSIQEAFTPLFSSHGGAKVSVGISLFMIIMQLCLQPY